MPSETHPEVDADAPEPHRYLTFYDARGRFVGRLTLPTGDDPPTHATARALADITSPAIPVAQTVSDRSVRSGLDPDEAERRQRDFRAWLVDEWIPRNGVASHTRDSYGRDIAEKSG